MAKNSLPSVDGERPDKPPRNEPEAATKLAEPPASEGYIPRKVDVKMTRAQAAVLRDKLRALQDSGATTADGKPVDNRAQTVRWILENEVSV